MNKNHIYYKCKKCGWIGLEENLHLDSVETCMGPDIIEICPECGSAEIYQYHD